MKTYRYANLLAIFVTFLAGFASVANKTSAFFAVPAVPETSDRTTVASDFTLASVQPTQRGTIPAISTNLQGINRYSPTTPTRSSTPVNNICKGNTTYIGHITINGKSPITLCSTDTLDGVLSHNHAYILNQTYYGRTSQHQYIFAHNSPSLFQNLQGLLPINSTFSVTLNGTTTNYQVKINERVCVGDNKDYYNNPNYDCKNWPQDKVLNMWNPIFPQDRGTDLSIMTCEGTPIGNGATHRRVLYAVKI